MSRPACVLWLLVCVAHALFTSTVAEDDFKCPITRNLPHAVPCKAITMPPKLCTACRMRPVGPGGTFKNPRDIYELNTPQCRAGIQEYVDANPCDYKRKAQLQKFWIKKNQVLLGDFMYSICEQCCDCLPWGSRKWNYEKRKQNGKLVQVSRGNCPAHAWYDICIYWPDIRDVKPPGGKLMPWRPSVCKELCKWFLSPQRKNWLYNPFIKNLDWKIKRFLWQVTWYGRCRNPVVWKECAHMEYMQRRV